MLNPDLKLNPKIFDKDVEFEATREGYGKGLVLLGERNPNVVVLTADLSESTKSDTFAKKFPERFFECGVAEQNMAAVAAGLAVAGKIPFISSYAAFSPGKNWETLRTTVIYNNANVKIAGHHAGIATGPDGVTHQATEDIAITRCWPGLTIFTPADSIQAKKVTITAATIDGPVYLRFSRDKTPIITTEATPFETGKVQTFWTSEAPVLTIFSIGYMTYYALLAAKELEEEQIHIEVVNVATIKPLDLDGVLNAVGKSGAVVTAEDHQTAGGLGGAIAELLAKKRPTHMGFIGMQDTFAESGKPDELRAKYHMDVHSIKEAVKEIIRK
jgi:transketolase